MSTSYASAPLLAPPHRLELGSIVTIRMRGHARSPVPGQEYFAPAVVVGNQDATGETVELLIWDSSAGTYYNPSYPVRDLSTRGDGPEREVYELRANVGQVLFSPERFEQLTDAVVDLQARVLQLEQYIMVLNETGKSTSGQPDGAAPVYTTESDSGSAKHSKKQ